MREKLQAYLDSVLPIVHLSNWAIKVSKDIPGDDAWADIEVSENLWQANIRISDDFFREDPESQRRIIAHELVHVHQAAIERLVHSLEGVLGSQAYELLDKVWDVESERSAESLSFVVAQTLPLPHLAAGRARK